jgi:hypothetical protein
MSKLTFEQIVENWAKKSPAPSTSEKEVKAPVAPPKVQAVKKEKETKPKQKPESQEKGDVVIPILASPPVDQIEEIPEPEEVDSIPPERSYKSGVMKCGHLNWMVDNEEDELHKQAVEAGYCCHEFLKASGYLKKGNPLTKPYLSIRWDVKGLWHPIPQNVRRTPEKESSPGWPGLCSDPDTGLYIGGIANDCRHNVDALNKCVVHQFKPKKAATPQDEEAEEESESEESTKIKKLKKKAE